MNWIIFLNRSICVQQSETCSLIISFWLENFPLTKIICVKYGFQFLELIFKNLFISDPIRQGFNAVYSVNWCPTHCTGNRTCDGDRCVCKKGYLGPNCDMHLCPLNCSKGKGNPECNDVSSFLVFFFLSIGILDDWA